MDGGQRLAQAVRARRLAMGGMTQAQAASRAGVSDTTWNQIERGQPVSDRSLAKVSQALWEDAGAGTAILEGAEPPEAQLELSASGVDLDEPRALDPAAYELIVRQAELALERARERRHGSA